MQAHYPFTFEREMGCTADELRTWLPGASRNRAIEWRERGAVISIDEGCATLNWETLEPRRIALITLPRLRVRTEAIGVDEDAWQRFMKHFDLYTQRGGG
jgi:hypothetical protein